MNDQNSNSFPEEGQNDLLSEIPNQSKPNRHGCVTAWLIFMIIANSITTLIYTLRANAFTNISSLQLSLLIIGGSLNIAFAVMLLQWKKYAFYGFAITAIVAFANNISIGISVTKSLLGLLGFAVLYSVLKIKENGISAWDQLK
jgi:hypothetical protein